MASKFDHKTRCAGAVYQDNTKRDHGGEGKSLLIAFNPRLSDELKSVFGELERRPRVRGSLDGKTLVLTPDHTSRHTLRPIWNTQRTEVLAYELQLPSATHPLVAGLALHPRRRLSCSVDGRAMRVPLPSEFFEVPDEHRYDPPSDVAEVHHHINEVVVLQERPVTAMLLESASGEPVSYTLPNRVREAIEVLAAPYKDEA